MMFEIDGKLFALLRSSEILEADGSTGKKYWQGHVVRGDDGRYYTTTSSWHIPTKSRKMSKVMWAVPHYAEPKNLGKVNATSNEEQAHAEFESMLTKERRLRAQERVQPQLAHKLKDKYLKLQYPVLIQPKYDGKRLVTDGEVMWSRGNKDQLRDTVQHILPIATKDGMLLDGELLLPYRATVNEVISAAHKFHPGVSDTLIYTVYDIADLDVPFSVRWARLCQWYDTEGKENPFVCLSDVYLANTYEEGLAIHATLTEQGFEGTIWRNSRGMYKSGKRSADLLKHKDFVDAEYQIVDIIPQGGGTGERRAKFVCVDEKGDQFESNSTGTEAEQMEYLTNKDAYIGKWATVKYREMSGARQVPFHSNVLQVRDTKDGGH